MTTTPSGTCLACSKATDFLNDRYCNDCRCMWCGGNATEGESFETAQGWRFCSDTCAMHHDRVLRADMHERD